MEFTQDHEELRTGHQARSVGRGFTGTLAVHENVVGTAEQRPRLLRVSS